MTFTLDPYLLDFLNLPGSYLEHDLEMAILRELENFILEIGKGFAFIERQKRIIIDDEDYYIDLLFFHRKLRRLVAIDLKIGKFQAKYKGQMELYLKWLNRYDFKKHITMLQKQCKEENYLNDSSLPNRNIKP